MFCYTPLFQDLLTFLNLGASSNVIEVIRPILNFFFFFFEKRFYTHQKHKTAYSKQKIWTKTSKRLLGKL